MPSWLTLKLGGMILGGLAALSFVLLAFHWKNTMTERGEKLAVICSATRSASGQPKLKCSEVPQQIQFMGDALNAVRAKTAAAQAADAAHAREVETRQNIASQESSHDYQAELARVRADYAERLRRAATRGTDQGSRGKPSVPGVATGAGGPVAAPSQNGLPSEDALIATEQALQLKAIQDWARKVHLAPEPIP
jgi:hypothetical protein